jgi:hypothetical protein
VDGIVAVEDEDRDVDRRCRINARVGDKVQKTARQTCPQSIFMVHRLIDNRLNLKASSLRNHQEAGIKPG